MKSSSKLIAYVKLILDCLFNHLELYTELTDQIFAISLFSLENFPFSSKTHHAISQVRRIFIIRCYKDGMSDNYVGNAVNINTLTE